MKLKPAALILGLFSLIVLGTVGPSATASDDEPVVFEVDRFHSRIVWEAVTGSGVFLGFFNGAAGAISFVESDPARSSVAIVITMDKLMTGVDRLDAHLKSDEFFDAEAFPDVQFQSTVIERTGDATAAITGDLTFHGVTKSITLNARFRNHVDFGSSERIAFGAETTIKRSDFGVTHMDDWIEDDVKIRIELEGVRSKESSEETEE